MRSLWFAVVNPMPNEEYLEQLYRLDGEEDPYYRNYILERTNRRRSYNKQYQRRLKLIENFPEGKENCSISVAGVDFF